jgi:hypothetical protein
MLPPTPGHAQANVLNEVQINKMQTEAKAAHDKILSKTFDQGRAQRFIETPKDSGIIPVLDATESQEANIRLLVIRPVVIPLQGRKQPDRGPDLVATQLHLDWHL